RLPSPSMTIGGGSIVEPHARRHRRGQLAVLQQLEVLAQGSPEEIVLERLRSREPVDIDGLVTRTGLAAAEARSALVHLLEAHSVLLLDGSANGAVRLDGRAFVVSAAGWRRLSDQVAATLTNFHQSYP